MGCFGFRRWRDYQHYPEGSRSIAWVKFYVALLDDSEAEKLSHARFGVLSRLLLLAARTSNCMLDDTAWLSRKIGRVTRKDLDALAHWLTPVEVYASKPASTPASASASTLATPLASTIASTRALAREEQRRGEKKAQRARAVASLPEPLEPEPADLPPELHTEPITAQARKMTAGQVERAESEITDLPLECIAPLQDMLDARARCLMAASKRGGLPPYMPGSPAAEVPWTSQWVPEGVMVAAEIANFCPEDFVAACKAMVKTQFNLGHASAATFRKSFVAKCEQVRADAAVKAELGEPEPRYETPVYEGDPSLHVNLTLVKDDG